MPTTRSHRGAAPQSVTSAATSREEDQRHRLRQYLLTMSVRTVCFVLAIVVDEWYRWVFAAAAVVLPFVAVVAANAVAPRVRGRARPVTPSAAPATPLGSRPADPVPGTARHPEQD
ncbi:DUF3099 domain-containing protein [Phycicoccus endophyticus]|uniref:DUF3099 domain-containing protein n=1 Tax=Phycicoccus endophyticus TaxID=1690220 RepID=A0A7G9R4F5_9MICO|nr:DUF3099 domain-containing protein [Phycicoccus endophyticus]NHI18360.1 DUF3099 domain-containing protein [Phycicoccus endophyticus]QNN50480.1 DUF3099 domain-containing protein [Phycicoccus endophyticus]GGL24410.1 hypothetical protein GCM10012283_03150 [Phycicoccus endophyticus]